MGDLRAITLRQPYPSLVARRLKRWEPRPWKTSYRGPLAIHAGMRWEPGWRNIWVDPDRDGPELERYDILIEQLGLEPTEDVNGSGYWTAWGRLPLGAVVAVAMLTDCIPIVGHGQIPEQPGLFIEDHQVHYAPDARCLWLCKHRVDGAIDTLDRIEDQRPYGHWEPGNWAWKLDGIRPLAEPVPAKGRRGLWRPDDDLTTRIAAEVGS